MNRESNRQTLSQIQEAERRVKTQARTQEGKEALWGEWMILNYRRKPIICGIVEAFCADMNREWGR